MKTRYDIEVQPVDIEKAIRNDSSDCAVATALARAIPTATHVMVDVQSIRFSLAEDRRRLIYFTPSTVQRYVVAFDAGDKIEPFSFQLRDPAFDTPMQPRVNGKLAPGHNWTEGEAILRTSRNEEVRKKGVRPPKLVSGRKRRVFGIRSMRINQVDTDATG